MSFPLQGVRVLELGQIIAGTYGSQVLSDLGAEVDSAIDVGSYRPVRGLTRP